MVRIRTALVVCWIAAGVAAWGQAGATASAPSGAKPAAYEVVSIKPSDSKSQNGGWRTLADGFQFQNMPLQWLVYSAYDIIMESQVSGLPGWAETDPYDVDAKVDAQTAESWKNLTYKERDKLQQPMLQALLADRCQLKAHEETKELPVYALVIARSGLKMKAAPAEEKSSWTMSGGKRSLTISANATSMESITDSLSWSAGRIIVDKTGLADKKFDFELKWTPDDQRGADPEADAAPSIFTALEEQLGLKLVSDKAPEKVLVIDHMERPSAN